MAESFEEGANVSEVARRHGVAVGCSQLGGTSSRRHRTIRHQPSCRSGSLPRAVRRRQKSRSAGARAMKRRRR